MLKLTNLSKDYYVDKKPIRVLKKINLEFREKEFVSILGPSGCGKTTLLNIIGGLDRYSEGDLLVDNVSTKNYVDADWDSYRNHRIGFVFQSYNLISHLTVLSNVELALTLSGVSPTERKEKATKMLEKVGLADHLNKKPNQLSGGQMQRVAIARALINEPNIILADEPTGALDSETSVEIMELLKEISKNKLIIMVTHNKNLAEEYSNRIVSLLDGRVTDDTNPFNKKDSNVIFEKTKKTSMSFFTAMSLSFKNLLTKKARTILTAFAGSIGIIGIALSLSLKNGFDIYLDKLESDNFAVVPLEIGRVGIDINSMMNTLKPNPVDGGVGGYDYTPSRRENNLDNPEFVEVIDNKITKVADSVIKVYGYRSRFANIVNGELITRYNNPLTGQGVNDPDSDTIFINQTLITDSFIAEKMKVHAQKDSNNKYQAYLFLNSDGRVPNSVLNFLGLPTDRKLEYNEILGKTFRVYKQADYTLDNKENIKNKFNEQIEIEITSILSSFSQFIQVTPGIYYNDEVVSFIRQDDPLNILMSYMIYPKGLDNKKEIKAIIDEYNDKEGRLEKDIITYLDTVELSVSFINTLTNSVSIILIAFSAISLFVSSVMIGIITYTSVLERTKEIGVLRSIGARKKDISRVFNAEGIMLGFISGVLGIILTLGLNPIISKILEPMVEYSGIARLNILHGAALVLISVLLTLIAGLIPSRIAANKDPVVALRTE
ncbi:ABC transporter ATP-binding protein/permease [Haploplasma axanthum]|uniref:ABC transporter ATP-binding protein n=1 Tax=Haploplasma axanthum TaxID=29552 RepID=A0A449BBK6_HAPAX|nr:ABC transporter ATP-binding protein/permease [Haploplasma axanthum]VEU79827.1 ABC transporter ATP-binding protein [Haploplasma axanthum]